MQEFSKFWSQVSPKMNDVFRSHTNHFVPAVILLCGSSMISSPIVRGATLCLVFVWIHVLSFYEGAGWQRVKNVESRAQEVKAENDYLDRQWKEIEQKKKDEVPTTLALVKKVVH